MPQREKLSALILSRRDINEADRLLTIFTRARGLLKVVAKGVRRIPSKRGGHLEPLTRVLTIIVGRGDRLYLAAAETLDFYQPLHRDEIALGHGQRLVQSVTALCGEGEPQTEVFDALCQAWKILPELSAAKQNIVEAALSLYMLQLTGLMPNLNSCHICAAKPQAEAVILDAAAGGWHCLSCHGSLAGARHSIAPNVLKALRWLSRQPSRALLLSVDEPVSQQIVSAARCYLAHLSFGAKTLSFNKASATKV